MSKAYCKVPYRNSVLKARLDMHSIEAALSDDASFPDGKIEPGFLDRYANRIVKAITATFGCCSW